MNENDIIVTNNIRNPFKSQSQSLLILNDLKKKEKKVEIQNRNKNKNKNRTSRSYFDLNVRNRNNDRNWLFIKNRKHFRKSIWQECKDSTKENKHLTFSQLLPLNKMWQSYSNSLLTKLKSKRGKYARIMDYDATKIDLHGAFIKIVKCKSRPLLKGCEGIIVAMTKNQFAIVCYKPMRDQVYRVPLNGTMFSLRVLKDNVIVIQGTSN